MTFIVLIISRGGFEPGLGLHNPFILKVSSVYSPIVRQNEITPFVTIISSKQVRLAKNKNISIKEKRPAPTKKFEHDALIRF